MEQCLHVVGDLRQRGDGNAGVRPGGICNAWMRSSAELLGGPCDRVIRGDAMGGGKRADPMS